MSRKTKTVTVEMEGRDRGKKFLLTELPAVQADKWANRALSAIGRANHDIAADLGTFGMAGIAVVGLRALMSVPWDELEPLLEEMMGCVQIVPSSGMARALIEGDIEEVLTFSWLRSEVLDVHVGFSLSAALSTWVSALKKAAVSNLTPMSQQESALS